MSKTKPTADLYDCVRRLRYATDTVAVGFSCGKDSAAVADLCITWFDRVALFYMYSVKNLSFHREYLRFWTERAGKKLVTGEILQVPHWTLSRKLGDSTLRDWNTRFATLPTLKLRDVEVEVARRTGVTWFAYGQKKADSLERRAMLNKCNGVMLESNRGFPLAEWSNRTVTQYLRSRDIPLSPEYAVLGCSYGGHLDGRYLDPIREHYPADFARICERFPFALAETERHRARAAAGELKTNKKEA